MSQLRADIDRGRTRDKVAFSDPAVVPLGTDEEAAGTPLPPEVIARERWREMHRMPPARPRKAAGRWRPVAVILAIVAIVVVLGLRLGS
jgi:hypothetical protein